VTAPDPAPRKRQIGAGLAVMLVAGNMIGSGVYLLPASLAAVGSSSVLGWIAGAVGALVLAAMFAVLGRLKPSPDGLIAYAAEGVHPAAGFTAQIAYWTSCWVGNAAIALALVGYLAVFFPAMAGSTATTLVAVGAVWLAVVANLFGPRLVARLGGLTLIVGLAPILAATVLGFLAFDAELFAASWNPRGLSPTGSLAASLAVVFWAFLGLECANAAAAVVRRPERNVPIAALGGVTLAAVVYLAATVAVFGVLPAGELARSTAPFADVVGRLAGAGAAGLVAACAMAKAAGTLGGWVLVTAQTSRSAAEKGLWPHALSSVDPTRTPVRDLLVAGVLTSAAVLASASPTLGGRFAALIEWSVVLTASVYVLSALALLRWTPEIADPGRRLATRALAVAALLFCAALIALAGRSSSVPALMIVAATLPVWLAMRAWRGRRRVPPAATR